jgi:hypothetical protein
VRIVSGLFFAAALKTTDFFSFTVFDNHFKIALIFFFKIAKLQAQFLVFLDPML